jgi:hypothetical protein
MDGTAFIIFTGIKRRKRKKNSLSVPLPPVQSMPDPIWKTILVTIFGMGMSRFDKGD